jgi:hypothetical protein
MTTIAPCYDVLPDGRVQVPLARVEGVRAVVARAIVRLVTVRGSWLSDRALGCVDVDQAIERGERYDGSTYALAVREQLALVPGVVAVSAVEQRTQPGGRLALRVTVTVDAGEGRQAVTLGTSPYGAGDPVAWYLLTRGLGGPIARGW